MINIPDQLYIFYYFSIVHPCTPVGLWTFILGLQIAKFSIFGQNDSRGLIFARIYFRELAVIRENKSALNIQKSSNRENKSGRKFVHICTHAKICVENRKF